MTRWQFLALAAGLVWAAPAHGQVIFGDPADYETQFQQVDGSPGTVTATRDDHETLRVFTRDIGGFAIEAARPVYQFDLSVLEQPLASAVLSLELLSAESNVDYGIEVWGSSTNRSGPLTAGDGGSAGEYGASGYEVAAQEVLADEETSVGAVFLDITGYLNARFEEFVSGGDAWAYLRLQPAQEFAIGSGVEAEFGFASADHANEAFHPRIDTVAIPEPSHAVLLAGLTVTWLLWRRILWRRRRADG